MLVFVLVLVLVSVCVIVFVFLGRVFVFAFLCVYSCATRFLYVLCVTSVLFWSGVPVSSREESNLKFSFRATCRHKNQ